MNPHSWETSLDMTFIENLTNYATPVKLPSRWTIRIDTHYLGGLRHWNNWEIADIGVLIFFRKNGKTIKSKVALLQSKRLYPNELNLDEDDEQNYIVGFGRLYKNDEGFNKLLRPRTFNFDNGSKYKALKLKDDQCQAIIEYQQKRGIPVHYLFYNPTILPYKVEVPLLSSFKHTLNEVGCRVVPSTLLYDKFDKEPENYSPSFGEVKFLLDKPFNEEEHSGGWRLEYFMSDLFINCHQGYIVKDNEDVNISELFYRRTGPISAAISMTFDMGE